MIEGYKVDTDTYITVDKDGLGNIALDLMEESHQRLQEHSCACQGKEAKENRNRPA
jgi:hypothetical protein